MGVLINHDAHLAAPPPAPSPSRVGASATITPEGVTVRSEPAECDSEAVSSYQNLLVDAERVRHGDGERGAVARVLVEAHVLGRATRADAFGDEVHEDDERDRLDRQRDRAAAEPQPPYLKRKRLVARRAKEKSEKFALCLAIGLPNEKDDGGPTRAVQQVAESGEHRVE